MKFIISAIVFTSIAIVLVYSPAQLFSRHDPVMIRLFNSNIAYKRLLKYSGYLLFVAGIISIIMGILEVMF